MPSATKRKLFSEKGEGERAREREGEREEQCEEHDRLLFLFSLDLLFRLFEHLCIYLFSAVDISPLRSSFSPHLTIPQSHAHGSLSPLLHACPQEKIAEGPQQSSIPLLYNTQPRSHPSRLPFPSSSPRHRMEPTIPILHHPIRASLHSASPLPLLSPNPPRLTGTARASGRLTRWTRRVRMRG